MKTLSHIVGSLITVQAQANWSRHLVTVAIPIWLAISVSALVTASPEFSWRAGAVGTGMVLVSFAAVATVRQSYHMLVLKGLVLVKRGEHQTAHPQSEIDYDRNLAAIGRLFARLGRRSRPARVAEMVAALIARLQWGYGDLAVNKLMLCGGRKC